MSSNKFIVDIQLAQFPLLNNTFTLVTYVEACVAGQYPASRGLSIFLDNKSGRGRKKVEAAGRGPFLLSRKIEGPLLAG